VTTLILFYRCPLQIVFDVSLSIFVLLTKVNMWHDNYLEFLTFVSLCNKIYILKDICSCWHIIYQIVRNEMLFGDLICWFLFRKTVLNTSILITVSCPDFIFFTRTWLCYVRVFAIANQSVSRLLSVCNVLLLSRLKFSAMFLLFTPFCTLVIRWPLCKISLRSSKGNPSVEG